MAKSPRMELPQPNPGKISKGSYAYYDMMLDSPRVQQALKTIQALEGTADEEDPYAVGFGYDPITDFSDHPHKAHPYKNTTTSAAGAFQIMGKTWDSLKKQLGLPSFRARNQQIAALALIDEKGALPNVLAGDLRGFIQKTGGLWASFPDSPIDQPHRSWGFAQRAWDAAGAAPSTDRPDNHNYQGPFSKRPSRSVDVGSRRVASAFGDPVQSFTPQGIRVSSPVMPADGYARAMSFANDPSTGKADRLGPLIGPDPISTRSTASSSTRSRSMPFQAQIAAVLSGVGSLPSGRFSPGASPSAIARNTLVGRTVDQFFAPGQLGPAPAGFNALATPRATLDARMAGIASEPDPRQIALASNPTYQAPQALAGGGTLGQIGPEFAPGQYGGTLADVFAARDAMASPAAMAAFGERQKAVAARKQAFDAIVNAPPNSAPTGRQIEGGMHRAGLLGPKPGTPASGYASAMSFANDPSTAKADRLGPQTPMRDYGWTGGLNPGQRKSIQQRAYETNLGTPGGIPGMLAAMDALGRPNAAAPLDDTRREAIQEAREQARLTAYDRAMMPHRVTSTSFTPDLQPVGPAAAPHAQPTIAAPRSLPPARPDSRNVFPPAPPAPTQVDPFGARLGPALRQAFIGGMVAGLPGATIGLVGGLLGTRAGGLLGALGPGFDAAVPSGDRFSTGSGLGGIVSAMGGPKGAQGFSLSNPGMSYTSLGNGQGLRRSEKFGWTEVVGPDGGVRGISYDNGGGGLLGGLSRGLGSLFGGSDSGSKGKGGKGKGNKGGINGSGYSGNGLY